MGTQKRERQKANRALRQAEEIKAARSDAVKRNAVRWVLILIAAVGAVVLIAWIGGAFDSDDDTPEPTVPLTLPDITVSSTLPSSTEASSTPADSTLPATDATTTAAP